MEKHSSKKEMEGIVAAYFAQKYFAGKVCKVISVQNENDSVDIEIDNLKAQVVVAGMGKDFFWRMDQNGDHVKNGEQICLDKADPVSEIISAVKNKLAKSYSDVEQLILLIGCWVTSDIFDGVHIDLVNIQKQIGIVAQTKNCFKEIWVVEMSYKNGRIIQLWPQHSGE